MFAFLPLLFLPEGPGMFIRSLPAAVLYTIGASLLVALTIIPFLASVLLPREPTPSEGNAALRALTSAIRRVYGPALQRALAWPRTTCSPGSRYSSAALGLVPLIGFSLFPTADTPQFLIEIETAEGASLAETDRALRFVETELAKRPEVRHWFANLGRGNPLIYYNVTPRETRANVAEVFAELKDFDPRASPRCSIAACRFDRYPAARITVKRFENGPPIAAPIAIRVTGPELDPAARARRSVEALMRATPGTRDVHNPVRLLRTDLDLGIDIDKAALLGVSPGTTDRTVRLAVAGLAASRYREADGDEYDITCVCRWTAGKRSPRSTRSRSNAGGDKLPLRQLIDPQVPHRAAGDPTSRPRTASHAHR